MIREDVLTRALAVFNEYMPSQVIDDDTTLLIDEYIDMYVSPFINILPSECISSLISLLPQAITIDSINYKGGSIILPDDFGKLISFRYNTWERSLGESDLITERSPRRKLQENKFTAGNISRPVISLENNKGKKCLCFWGYKASTAADGYECQFIPKCESLDDILSLDEWLLTAYIYYTLSFVYKSLNEKEKAGLMMEAAKEILLSHNITPTQPISYEPEKTKK